jgi:hypothetical protein
MDFEGLIFLSAVRIFYVFIPSTFCSHLTCHGDGESETKKQGETLSEVKLQNEGQNGRDTK